MKIACRVYYEDTDAGGVVYYANYLRFLERGRTELLRALGFEQRRLCEEQGIVFAVRALSIDYRQPARLDDLLEIHTDIEKIGRAQVTFAQRVFRGKALLVEAQVRVACLDGRRGKPVALPPAISDRLKMAS